MFIAHRIQRWVLNCYGWVDVLACVYSYVFTAAKLIAPVMDKKDWESGYDWVVETIKLDHEYLASKMEIEKALHYLKTKEFDKVIGHIPWVPLKLTAYQKSMRCTCVPGRV